MTSILDILIGVRNLPKIPCNIKVLFYTETIGGIEVNKVAIYNIEHKEEVEKAKDFEYCSNCVVMYESQYNALFKPLFENIGLLNKEITNLQNKLDN